MTGNKEQQVIDFIRENHGSSSKEIFEGLDSAVSYATLKRILTKLISDNYLIASGRGKGTKYLLSPILELNSTYRY